MWLLGSVKFGALKEQLRRKPAVRIFAPSAMATVARPTFTSKVLPSAVTVLP